MGSELLGLARDAGGVLELASGPDPAVYLTDSAGRVRRRRIDFEEFEALMSAVVDGGVSAAAGHFEDWETITLNSEMITLSDIEARIDALHGERCFDANGALDSRKVQEFANDRGIGYVEAEKRLRGQRMTEGEREGKRIAELAHQLVARGEAEGREIDYLQAVIEVQRDREPRDGDGSAGDRGRQMDDRRIVELADELIAREKLHGREMDFTTAIIEVQMRGRS